MRAAAGHIGAERAQQLIGAQSHEPRERRQRGILAAAAVEELAHPRHVLRVCARLRVALLFAVTLHPGGQHCDQPRLGLESIDAPRVEIWCNWITVAGPSGRGSLPREKRLAAAATRLPPDVRHQRGREIEHSVTPVITVLRLAGMHFARHHDIDLTAAGQVVRAAVVEPRTPLVMTPSAYSSCVWREKRCRKFGRETE